MYVLCAQSYQYLQTCLDNLTPSCAHRNDSMDKFTHERVPDQAYTLKFTASQLVYMTDTPNNNTMYMYNLYTPRECVRPPCAFGVCVYVFCVCVCLCVCARVCACDRERE